MSEISIKRSTFSASRTAVFDFRAAFYDYLKTSVV
jgi:hypothetical protein